VGELVGKLEALNEPVAKLLVFRLALVACEAFTKALHSISER
jgi:hypothetical protein